MDKIAIKSRKNAVFSYIKLMLISSVVGVACGLIGSVFDLLIEYVTEVRTHNWLLIIALPAAGVIIPLLYKLIKSRKQLDTDYIIASVKENRHVPLLLAPAIFVSTALTHLFGGSAGREGAALQLGGSIGSNIGKWLKARQNDMPLVILAGMSGFFAALFGTPLTATVFVLEIISFGGFYFSGIVPSVISSFTAFSIAQIIGIKAVKYDLSIIPDIGPSTLSKVVFLAAICAALSILFCKSMEFSKHIFAKIKNPYFRIVSGGCIVVALSFIFRSGDYNGAGMGIISDAIAGNAAPYAFIVKLIFTSVTIGCGFKGGEIIPCFFVGASFGCIMGSIIGLDCGFAAAIGLVALFSAAAKCPIATIILSIELFGAEGILYFAVACVISYFLSGKTCLYKKQ